MARLRSALLAAVTPEQLTRAVEALIAQAHTGNVQAIRELFDRVLGRPVELDLMERLERLERQLGGNHHDAESTSDAA